MLVLVHVLASHGSHRTEFCVSLSPGVVVRSSDSLITWCVSVGLMITKEFRDVSSVYIDDNEWFSPFLCTH